MSDVQVAHNLSTKPRTVDVSIDENVDFGSLHLSDRVLQGLKSAGFHRPSPIQLKAIPLGRCGLDLIVQAKSGTGKTCVFSVVALEGVNVESNSVQVVVLAPTREIAVQIWEVINSLGSAIEGLRCYTFIGGMPLESDKKKLKRCHIAVATPGRLKQLLEQGVMSPDSVRLFVLDEADKLLEESFQETVNWIYSCLPENKQMLALSATYPEALAQHLTAYMRAPTFVRLNAADPALLGIRQYYKKVAFHPLPQKVFEAKVQQTLKLLSSISFNQCLIFSNYQTRAESLSDQLSARGWPSTHISGQQEQQKRLTAMAKLRSYKCRVLVTTDLTSRGIDAENVNLVLHLDVPRDHETYLHRVGRAGRFGTYGASIVLAGEGKELNQLCDVQDKCNTDILALPDPIPSDLAKSSGYVSLDHLVSTQQLTSSTPLPLEGDIAVEDRPHMEGRLTREGGSGDSVNNPLAKNTEQLAVKSESKIGGGDTSLDVPNPDQSENQTQMKASDDETLYVPDKPAQLHFEYDDEPERKPICFSEIADMVNDAPGDYQQAEAGKTSSSCPRNIQALTDQMADALDYIHLGQKQAMCRMSGEEEVKGLLASETLGNSKSGSRTSAGTKKENSNGQKSKKKGRLVKEDYTLGEEYFLKLAAKDDFPDSDKTETDESETTESETSSESETTSYRESDFTQAQNRQKTAGRRRTNSYRRLLSKTERNKQSEGQLYADDEGSETPGAAVYPKLEWTPIVKPTKAQADVKSPTNQKQHALYHDSQYHAEVRNKRLAANHHDGDSRDDSESSSSASSSENSEEEREPVGYPFPPRNSHPHPQYDSHYPQFPAANFHSFADTQNLPEADTGYGPTFERPRAPFNDPFPGDTRSFANPPNLSPSNPQSYEYEWYLYEKYAHHQAQAAYYAALYRQSADARKMADTYRRQQRYIKHMASCAVRKERRS